MTNHGIRRFYVTIKSFHKEDDVPDGIHLRSTEWRTVTMDTDYDYTRQDLLRLTNDERVRVRGVAVCLNRIEVT